MSEFGSGIFRLEARCADGRRLALGPPLRNTWLYTWGHIATQCILLGNRDLQIAGVYVEYENVATPSDPVSVPSVERSDTLDYYQQLAGSTTRDFLRLPLVAAPKLEQIPGISGLSANQYNRAVLYAQSTGQTAGVHGRAFGSAANSKVCGLAVVAMPDPQDWTQDVLFARAYYDTADQFLVPDGAEIGVSYQLDFS